jgi:hypothetical protein
MKKQKGSKERLVEVMSRLDKTFKPRLNESMVENEIPETDDDSDEESNGYLDNLGAKAEIVVMSHLSDLDGEMGRNPKRDEMRIGFIKFVILKLRGNLTQYINPDKMFEDYKKEYKVDMSKMDMEESSQPEGVKYRAEVAAVGEDVWSTNSMTYDTEEEAKKWLDGLSQRWFGYDMGRVVPTTTPKGEPVDMENDDIYQNFRK